MNASLSPPYFDQAVSPLDRQVVAVENACRDRDLYRFPRRRFAHVGVVAVDLSPRLAVVEDEDGAPAGGLGQFEHRRANLSDLVRSRRWGLSEPLRFGRGVRQPLCSRVEAFQTL